MTIGFLRPVKAAGDVKELEYISALHQTDSEIRPDGSIRGEQRMNEKRYTSLDTVERIVSQTYVHHSCSHVDNDIVNFLMSRYGMDISAEEVRRHVIRGLGGGDEEVGIDLMEVVAMLLIPTLLKAATPVEELPDGVIRPRYGMLDYVLSMILHDVRFVVVASRVTCWGR
jgi:hypothetical protein